MAVNITTDTNTVKVTSTTTNNVKIVDNRNNTSVSVSQPTTQVIKVATVGPQGPVGPAGATASTASFVTTSSFNALTSSFNAFTSSYNTGSFTGSFIGSLFGTSSWATNALTASYLSGYVSPFPYTGSALITGSLGITGSTSILSGSLTIGSVNATNTLILSGSTPRIVFYNSGSTSSNSSILIQDEAWGLKTTSNVFRFLINGSGSSGLPVGAINISKSGNNFTNIGIYPNLGNASAGGIYISGSGNVGIKTDTPTSGTLHINGTVFASSYTGSLFGTASFANNTISASFSTSASFVISSSRAVSSSYAVNATSASNISPAITNNVDNYILTATGGGTINGEGQLTFDGTRFIANSSFQQGNNTSATGDYSHAEGNSTIATGDNSHAEGSQTQAIGVSSHAEGKRATSYGSYSHAEGQETQTGTNFAFKATVSSGVFTIDQSYGDITLIFAIGSTLVSDDTTYDNLYGKQLYTISAVNWDGTNTIITITDSSINTSFSNIGDVNYILQWTSYSGAQPISSEYSHAEGYQTTALGSNSHAQGDSTLAVGAGSHAEGKGTIALGNYQHVQGQFNLPVIVSSSFIHGNGTDANNRSNLIHAYNSTVEITGSLNVSGSITGSLLGTATNATNATQAEYAISALSSSFATTASFAVSSSRAVSSSFATTASYVENAQTASYVLQAVSSSFATTASYASNGGVTQLLAGPNITLAPTNGLGQVTISSTAGGGSSFNTATGSYGSFYSTQTQTNVASTARSMSLNITDISNGVSVSGSTNPFNTYIKTENAGVYDIQFSAQVDKTDSGTDEIWIWLRKNGTDLTDTATSVQLQGNGAHYVAAWNFFANAAANDYFQLMWYSPDANVRLHAESAFGVVPGIPSLIVTANRVDQFLSNTGSFSGSFTGQFTGSLFGTSSFATTASYALNAGGGGIDLGLVQAMTVGLQNIF